MKHWLCELANVSKVCLRSDYNYKFNIIKNRCDVYLSIIFIHCEQHHNWLTPNTKKYLTIVVTHDERYIQRKLMIINDEYSPF